MARGRVRASARSAAGHVGEGNDARFECPQVSERDAEVFDEGVAFTADHAAQSDRDRSSVWVLGTLDSEPDSDASGSECQSVSHSPAGCPSRPRPRPGYCVRPRSRGSAPPGMSRQLPTTLEKDFSKEVMKRSSGYPMAPCSRSGYVRCRSIGAQAPGSLRHLPKKLQVVVVLVALAAVFVGCRSGDGTAASSPELSATTEPTRPAELSPRSGPTTAADATPTAIATKTPEATATPVPEPTPTPVSTPTSAPTVEPEPSSNEGAGEAIIQWLSVVKSFNEVYADSPFSSIKADYDLTDLDALVLNFDSDDPTVVVTLANGLLGAENGLGLLDVINANLEKSGITSPAYLANRIILSTSFGDVACSYQQLEAVAQDDADLACVDDLVALGAGDLSVQYERGSASPAIPTEEVDETPGELAPERSEISIGGVLLTGTDVSPGFYIIESVSGRCSVEAMETLSDDRESWSWNTGDRAIIELRSIDVALTNDADCGAWQPWEIPVSLDNPPTIMETGGVHVVGFHVAPGIYSATPKGSCRVETAAEYPGDDWNSWWRFDEGDRALIEIAESDTVFVNDSDCGTWIIVE